MLVDFLQLQSWYQTRTGSCLLRCEQKRLQDWWPARVGATVLQLGGLTDLLTSVCTGHETRYWIAPIFCSGVGVVACYDELPFKSGTVDMAVAMHVLEFCDNPMSVLHQIWDALTPEGQLLVFTFNAWSSWRVRQFFADKTQFPWSGRFLSPVQLQSLLKEVGYYLIKDQSFCFGPRSYFLEKIGQWVMPMLGIVNVVLVQKQVPGFTGLAARRGVLVPSRPVVPVKLG